MVLKKVYSAGLHFETSEKDGRNSKGSNKDE